MVHYVRHSRHLISKKTGFARLDKICDTTAEALKDAEAVLIEVDIHQLEEKFSAMIPEFARGAAAPRVRGDPRRAARRRPVEVRAVACGHGPRGLPGGGEQTGARLTLKGLRARHVRLFGQRDEARRAR